MAELDITALSVCIIAVDDLIKSLEDSLKSGEETSIEDIQDTQELILSYEKVAMRLKMAYKEDWNESSNSLSYEKLLEREGRIDRWPDI
jgi:hypothetical protein